MRKKHEIEAEKQKDIEQLYVNEYYNNQYPVYKNDYYMGSL